MLIFPNLDNLVHTMEVGDIWLHVPMVQNACINIDECPTPVDLIKLATDRDEQLQVSLANNYTNISRIVRNELQRQNHQHSSQR